MRDATPDSALEATKERQVDVERRLGWQPRTNHYQVVGLRFSDNLCN